MLKFKSSCREAEANQILEIKAAFTRDRTCSDSFDISIGSE